MDSTNYKDVTVQRGYTYHYYHVPASTGKPTLFFIHGFPSTSFDWSRQVAFFQPKGFGLLVPDCLGYGGTSKPSNYEEYRWKLQAQDLVDILDAEGLKTVVGIGHDWGSAALSRLANFHPDRFSAYAWVALSYVPPNTQSFDFERTTALMRERVGTDLYGYWQFFCQPDGPELSEKNIDSFIQLAYPPTPQEWFDYLCPLGRTREWIGQNRLPGRTSWLTEQEYATMRASLVRGGLQGPMNYYKLAVSDVNLADNQALPEEAWYITKPALFVSAARDAVCRAVFGKAHMKQYAPHADVVELETGHWTQLEATEQLNDALEKWLDRLPATKSSL